MPLGDWPHLRHFGFMHRACLFAANDNQSHNLATTGRLEEIVGWAVRYMYSKEVQQQGLAPAHVTARERTALAAREPHEVRAADSSHLRDLRELPNSAV
jgi:hypothetical protein